MYQKVLCVVLAVCAAAGALTGCAAKPATPPESSVAETSAAETSVAETNAAEPSETIPESDAPTEAQAAEPGPLTAALCEKLASKPDLTMRIAREQDSDMKVQEYFLSGDRVCYRSCLENAAGDILSTSAIFYNDGADTHICCLPDASVYAQGDDIGTYFAAHSIEKDALCELITNNFAPEYLSGTMTSGSAEINGTPYRYEEYSISDAMAIRYLYDSAGDICYLTVINGEDENTLPFSIRFEDKFPISPDASPEAELCRGYTECSFLNDRLYLFYDVPCTWTEAEAACVQLGGCLPAPSGNDALRFLAGLAAGGNAKNLWLRWQYNPNAQDPSDEWEHAPTGTTTPAEGLLFGYLPLEPSASDDRGYPCIRFASESSDEDEMAIYPAPAAGDEASPVSSFGYICVWDLIDY